MYFRIACDAKLGFASGRLITTICLRLYGFEIFCSHSHRLKNVEELYSVCVLIVFFLIFRAKPGATSNNRNESIVISYKISFSRDSNNI